MKITITDEAKKWHALTEVCIRRSQEMWRQGQRTTGKVAKFFSASLEHYGLHGAFLASSYMGAELTTLTTADRMVICLTDELPDQANVEALYKKKTKP